MPKPSSASTPLPHAAEFLSSLAVERGLASNTIDAYRRDLRRYNAFLDGRAADAAVLTEYVESMRAEGLTPTTAARRLAAVRGFHAFLVAEGHAEDDPTVLVESPRRGQPLPKALTVEEVFALLEAPDAATRAGRRDRSLLEFMYATGARVSEVTALNETEIDLEEATVVLTGKGDRQRLVPIGRAAIAAIRAYLPDRSALRQAGMSANGRSAKTRPSRRKPLRIDEGAMFLNLRGRRLTRQGVWGIVRKAADAAGIDDVSPHVLRHSAATHMVHGGADLRTVQEILGHASISTTQVYTRVSPQHLFEVYVAAHPRSRH